MRRALDCESLGSKLLVPMNTFIENQESGDNIHLPSTPVVKVTVSNAISKYRGFGFWLSLMSSYRVSMSASQSKARASGWPSGAV